MKRLFTSLQWTLFILMGSVIVPIAVASSYGLDSSEIGRYLARVLFVLGITGVLQATIGHRMPIFDGSAGVWWSVFTLYTLFGVQLYGSHKETLRALSFCVMASGVLFIILSVTGVVNKVAKLFTPTVMGTYLLLLVTQMTGTFLKGMAGVTADTPIQPLKLVLSLVVVLMAFMFGRIKAVATHATLISIVLGWILFALFGQANPIEFATRIFQLPEIFPYGPPIIDGTMTLNSIFLTFLLLTNMLAAISAMRITFDNLGEKYDENAMRRSGVAAGISHIMAGSVSTLGSVSISSSAAFVANTQNTDMIAFIIGNALITLISLFPPLVSIFAALPVAVGYATLVPTFGFGTISIAINQLESAKNKQTRNLAVGAAWFFGFGIMFFPANAYDGMNVLVRTILSNGLVVGAIIAVIIEQLSLRGERKKIKAKA